MGDGCRGNNPALRYLCIDLGDKRTGLALGDSITRLVSPLEVLEVPIANRNGEDLLDALTRAIDDQVGRASPAGLVFGLPINMDDTEGPRAKLVRAFAARLAARTTHPIHFQDERLSSAAADWSMSQSGLTHKQKKARRDALAAASILRDFLAGLPAPMSPPDSP